MKKQEGGKGPVMGMTKLILAPQQKQQLNLHLVQQMKLLQLGALELEQYVREAVEANPLLEFPGEAEGTAWQETAQEVYRRKRTRDQEDEPLPDPVANAGRQEKTLQQVVEEQLGCLRLSGVDRSLACYMAGTLDSRGWWTESVEETARAFGVTEDRVLQVLQQIQQMEPAGIGARDLSQCLLLQLENQGKEADLTRRIIREGLDFLARNQIPALARKFGCTQKEILAAKARICVLDPKPGARFAGAGPVVYQREDARVEDTGEGLKVTVYDTWGRKFVLNQEYLEWAGEQGNGQVKAYLKEQLGKARQLQQLLKERQQTLLVVFQALVSHQEPFFRLGPGHRQPLKLADLAEETGLAVSTVSRALQHKVIGCRWGSFTAGSFLQGQASSHEQGAVTEERLQQLIRELIEGEDKHHPLSDQAICRALEQQGVQVARRTVNKYRVKMGIGDKSARKEW